MFGKQWSGAEPDAEWCLEDDIDSEEARLDVDEGDDERYGDSDDTRARKGRMG